MVTMPQVFSVQLGRKNYSKLSLYSKVEEGPIKEVGQGDKECYQSQVT